MPLPPQSPPHSPQHRRPPNPPSLPPAGQHSSSATHLSKPLQPLSYSLGKFKSTRGSHGVRPSHRATLAVARDSHVQRERGVSANRGTTVYCLGSLKQRLPAAIALQGALDQAVKARGALGAEILSAVECKPAGTSPPGQSSCPHCKVSCFLQSVRCAAPAGGEWRSFRYCLLGLGRRRWRLQLAACWARWGQVGGHLPLLPTSSERTLCTHPPFHHQCYYASNMLRPAVAAGLCVGLPGMRRCCPAGCVAARIFLVNCPCRSLQCGRMLLRPTLTPLTA